MTTQAPLLRWYQRDVKSRLYDQWAALGARSAVLAVLSTGSGKTILLGSVVSEHRGAVCCIAHRQELVGQISMALARFGVKHRIIAPEKVIRAICAQHLEEIGACFHWGSSPVGVAGVDTLVKRGAKEHANWMHQVSLWVCDEAHHLAGQGPKANKWAKAAAMFPNAKGLGVTATPCRSDGLGLGRRADGVFDEMVVGPSMRDLIDQGFLTDYRIVVAETHLNLTDEMVSKTTGDYVLDRGKGKAAVRESPLVGDVVKEYLGRANGKLGVCFTSDVETAGDVAARFRENGIPAEMLSGETPDEQRRDIMRRFKKREILVIVNCDLLGEGVDVPAIEVVMMARPTMSFGLFAQQFGRALRLMVPPDQLRNWDAYSPEQRRAIIANGTKPKALIIDHVANVIRHGLPDSRNDWTLDARERRGKGGDDGESLTACLNPTCLAPYPRAKPCCPFCGTKPEPRATARSPIEAVDGNMFELSPELLAALRGQQAENFRSNDDVRRDLVAQGLPAAWVGSNVKKHDAKRQAAENLRDAMAWWAGERRAAGQSDAEVMKRFYLTFGIDWLSACAQDRESMAALAARVDEKLTAASSALRIRA